MKVKVAHSAHYWRRAKEALGQEHGLGAGSEAGDRLCQLVMEDGYRPLLAESFSDPETHAGTVYKATNWTQAGTTKGFSQDHTDYYVANGS